VIFSEHFGETAWFCCKWFANDRWWIKLCAFFSGSLCRSD